MLAHSIATQTFPKQRWHSKSAPVERPGSAGADPAWVRCVTHHCVSVLYVAASVTLARLAAAQKFTEEALEFQERISQKNGLSYKETYLPGSLHLEPPMVNMEAAREEARMVLFGCVQEVLDRTGAGAPRFRTRSWHRSCIHALDEHDRLRSCLSASGCLSASASKLQLPASLLHDTNADGKDLLSAIQTVSNSSTG